MKRINNKINRICIAFLIVFVFSCNDFLDRNPIADYTSSGEFYSTEGGLKLVTTGVYRYARWMDDGFAWLLPLQHAFDLWTPYNVERGENNSIGAGGMSPSNGSLLWTYIFMYRTIARTNTVLDGALPYYDDLSLRGKQYVAEMKVIRAHAYYILTAGFGDVPFLTTTITPENYQKKQTHKREIVNFILDELEEAAEILDWTSDQKGRITKAFALGLRAKIALHFGTMALNDNIERGIWVNPDYYLGIARDASLEVIESGRHGLNPKYRDLFRVEGQNANVNNELIHQLMFSGEIATPSRHVIGFGQTTRAFAQSGRFPTQMLVDVYETNKGLRIDQDPDYDPRTPFRNRDPRLGFSIVHTGDTMFSNMGGNKVRAIVNAYSARMRFWSEANTGDTEQAKWEEIDNPDVAGPVATYAFVENGCGYIYRKYCDDDSEPIDLQTCNVLVMRFAEILLIYAEAKIELNDIDETVLNALNRIRARAYGVNVTETSRYPEITSTDQAHLRQRVRREWKVELFQEGSHLFNMRRWRTGDIENDQPSYGHPFPRSYQRAMWLEANPGSAASAMPETAFVNGYTLCTPDMVPNFKKSERHDLNDIPDYSAYAEKLRSRDPLRNWQNKFYIFPKPEGELMKNFELEQNEQWK